MKLLVVTQAVDREDPVLGFFHRWLEEFGRRTVQTTVIAQRVGAHALPGIEVLSLGKEAKKPKLLQILRFFRLIVRERKKYDAVFVHMTPIWLALGGIVFKLMGKRTYLWYEARGTRWPLKVATMFAAHVFSASPYGMPIETTKSIVTGHGIDTSLFLPNDEKRDSDLFATVGRITHAKHLPAVIDAFARVPHHFRLAIVGAPVTKADHVLLASLKNDLHKHQLTDRATIGPVPHALLPRFLRTVSFFLHASSTGLDKAALEAMACGCIVISCSPGVHPFLPECLRATHGTLNVVLQNVLRMPAEEIDRLRKRLRETVVEKHAVETLIVKLVSAMTS